MPILEVLDKTFHFGCHSWKVTYFYLFKRGEPYTLVLRRGAGTCITCVLEALFFEGKKILKRTLRPEMKRVFISKKDAKLLKMIAESNFDRKFKVWEKFYQGEQTREELKEYLWEELPKYILIKKLTNGRR